MSPRADAGVTLVELIVAVGLLGILSVIGASIIKNFQAQAAAETSRVEAERTTGEIVALLRKDLMRIMPANRQFLAASCAGPTCTFVLENGQRVTYQTACAALPPGIAHYAPPVAQGFCVPACPAGQVMRTVVTRAGGAGPGAAASAPLKVFGRNGGRSGILGAGTCFQAGGGAIGTMQLDVNVVSQVDDRRAVNLRTQETMTFGNASGVTVRRRR